MGLGYLTVKANMANEAVPIEGATVIIREMTGKTLYTLKTDSSGMTETVSLYAPDKVYTLDPRYDGGTYSIYRVEVRAPGFETEIINGVQIFDTITSLEEVSMHPTAQSEPPENILNIPPHLQALLAPRNQQGPVPLSSSRVQRRVIIPDFITVHLGRYNVNARNIRVPFPLYIKNVAASEIYPTWPAASLEANIRAIINFALNRVYTGWYRIKGYPFDITSSTTTDMYFVEGRNLFSSINVIVDRIIGEYLRRPNHQEPYFTEFCDGRTVSCEGLSQWGTVTLAQNGYTPMQILRYYYPSDLIIDTAPIAPITESFPGVSLTQGTQGPDVELMQRFLNRIRRNYPAISSIANPNGVYGADTATAVRDFQRAFSMPQTGIIDRATWNKISYIFIAVTKLAELTSEGDTIITSSIPPNTPISIGASGGLVTRLQYMLTYISQVYPEVPELKQDGSFGSSTHNAVILFQNRFGLTPTGVVNATTWAKIYEVYFGIKDKVPERPGITEPPVMPPLTGPVYPGTPLRIGSRGENVRIMQQFLTSIANKFPSIPKLTADGVFGPLTERSIIAFQQQFGLTADGIIGPSTWNAIVREFNNLTTPPEGKPLYPGTPLRNGSRGENVRIMQQFLNAIGTVYPSIPALTIDGVFGPRTENAVRAFQRQFGLTADGVIGPITWNAIVTQYYNLSTTPPVPVRTIVLDPGHGGTDPGAVNGSRLEKNDNLRMALAVQNNLQKQGQRIIMTRSTDINVSLDERSAISNRNNADIFVSLHRNSFTSPTANGVETLVQTGSAPINTTNAQNVQNEIVSVGVQSNRGVRQGNFAVLRNTQAPSMLVELGFISNAEDNRLFDHHFDAYAAAITRGIMKSLSKSTTPPNFFNYTVQSGDTLWQLAQRFGTTVNAIMALNGLTGSDLTVGQILNIPN